MGAAAAQSYAPVSSPPSVTRPATGPRATRPAGGTRARRLGPKTAPRPQARPPALGNRVAGADRARGGGAGLLAAAGAVRIRIQRRPPRLSRWGDGPRRRLPAPPGVRAPV